MTCRTVLAALVAASYLVLVIQADNHCASTRFGCCDDGVTIATRKDKSGCPPVEICTLPPASGACAKSKPRWFYNSLTHSCEQFVYTGCGGNGNKFRNKEECVQACSHANKTKDVLPVQIGAEVTLTCNFEKIDEFKDWFLVQNGNTYPLSTGSGRKNMKVKVEAEAAYLTIKSATLKDSGSYICEVYNPVSDASGMTEMIIEVTDEKMDALPMPDDPLGAPLLSSTTYMPFTPQNVPEGATFNLTCDIPKGAEFKGWFLKKDDMVFTLDNYEYADHMKIIKSNGVSVLAIESIEQTDTGTYTCEVIDLATDQTATTRLDLEVVGSTDGPVTEIDPTLPFGTASTTLMPDMDGSTPMMPVEQTVPAGAEFTLDCDIPEGAQFDSWALVQGDNIILLDDGALDNMEVKPVTSNGGTTVLLKINGITVDDEGLYVCTIEETSTGDKASTQMQINVQATGTTTVFTTSTMGTTLPDMMMETTSYAETEPEPEPITKVTKPVPARVVTDTESNLNIMMDGTTMIPIDPTESTTMIPVDATETTLADFNMDVKSTTMVDDIETTPLVDLMGTTTTVKPDNAGADDDATTTMPDVDDDSTTPVMLDGDETTTFVPIVVSTTMPSDGDDETTPVIIGGDETTPVIVGGDETTTFMPIIDTTTMPAVGDGETTPVIIGGDETTSFMPLFDTSTMPDLIVTTTNPDSIDEEKNMTAQTTPGNTIYDQLNETTPDNGDGDMGSTEKPPVTFLSDSPGPLVDTETTMMPDVSDSTALPDASTSVGGSDDTTTMGNPDMTQPVDITEMTSKITDMPQKPTGIVDMYSSSTPVSDMPMKTSDIPTIASTDISKDDGTTSGTVTNSSAVMTSDIPSIPTTDSDGGKMTPDILTTPDIPDIPTTPDLSTDIPDIPTTTMDQAKTDERGNILATTLDPLPQESPTIDGVTSPISVPNVTDSIEIVTGCRGSRFGCCSDGYTYSQGPNYEDCPDTRTGYSLPNYPIGFIASKLDETDDYARLSVSWAPPQDDSVVNAYVVYSTSDLELPLDKWEQEEVSTPYMIKLVNKDKPVFFKVRAYNRQEKSPITPTFMYDDQRGSDSIQLLGGCYGTRYGCCDDGLTSAYGPRREGCPELEVVTMPITTTLITTTPYNPDAYTTSSTTTEKLEMEAGSEMSPPQNFKIMRDAVASDRVAISLRWDDPVEDYPVSEYAIRFTNDASLPRENWRRFGITDKQWQMALRRVGEYYFTIAGDFNGQETQQSPIISYSTEETMSMLYEPEGCDSTQYGCCDDELTAASGPNDEGCPRIVGGCAGTRWGCCSDNELTASGPNYEGCPRIVGGCAGTRWGCCSDGKNSANGPDLIGCEGDRQPCDVSEFGCCPDGRNPATGEKFRGCADAPQSEANPICLESKDTGLCTNYTVKWYYDDKFEACVRFWYGGCNRNKNRFDTEAECTAICEDGGNMESGGKDGKDSDDMEKPVCYQPTIVGECRGAFRRWTFDQRTKSCEEFVYGGCNGNDNRFNSPDECEEMCNLQVVTQDVCDQPKDKGPCFAAIPAYYYDQTLKECRVFTYGGCAGNDNRFTNKEECENRCKPKDNPEDICMLPAEQGLCRGYFPQYAYNSQSGRCERFTFGGCGGNANRFNDEASCTKKCGMSGQGGDMVDKEDGNTCDMPQDAGPCRGYMVRWFWDKEADRCDRFVYGGCQGNANNFETLEECESEMCHMDGKTTPGFDITTQALPQCSQPADSGPCFAYFQKWFYNPSTQKCQTFVYGGCRGNDNRFDSAQECEQVCSEDGEKDGGDGKDGRDGKDGGNQKGDITDGTDDKDMAGAEDMGFTPVVIDIFYDVCALDRASGSCDGYEIKWYFDYERKVCRRFVYTGCDGNGNRFDDWDTCKMRCENDDGEITPAPRTTPSRGAVSTTTTTTSMPTRPSRTPYETSTMFPVTPEDLSTTPAEPIRLESCDDVSCSDGYVCKESRTECQEFDEDCVPVILECVVANKPGECPSLDRELSEPCERLADCRGDSDCGGDRKCCWSNQCGGVCTEPETEEATGEVPAQITNPDDTEYEAELGEDVTMKCESRGNPEPTIVWYKNRKPMYMDGSKFVMSASGDLTIRQVKSTDSAEYICRVYNTAGEGYSDYLYVDLTVNSRVNILDDEETVDVELGGTAALTCDVQGYPKPSVSWTFRGFPVSGQRSDDSTLYLYDIRAEDAGDYTCTADNGASSDSKTVTLSIKSPLEANLADHNQTYTAGDDLTLTCETDEGATITWTKNGELVPRASNIVISGDTLMVEDMEESDTGFYSCRADNGNEVITVGTSIRVSPQPTKPPVPASCGDRPDLANCALIVRYNYCPHPVYRHFCCKSCLEAGKFTDKTRPFRRL